MFLRQSTAAVIRFGPAVDEVDGVTLQSGLISAIDHVSTGIMLSKNGATAAIRHATVTASVFDGGDYKVTLDTTDTNTLGHLRVFYYAAGTNAPIWRDFLVVPAMIYDSLVLGTDRLDANATHFADQAITAAAGVTLPSSVASPTNITAGIITTATNVTTVNGLAAGVITATSIAADAITAAKIADGAIDAATFAAGAINAAAIATDAITAAKIAADAIGASELAADAVTEIQSGLATSASISALNNVSSAQVQTAAAAAITAAALATASALAAAKTVVDAIKLATDNLPSDPADASIIAGLIAAVSAKLPTALSADGNIKSDVLAINAVPAAAATLEAAMGTILLGTVDSTGFTPTATEFEADVLTLAGSSDLAAAANFFNGRIITFRSGTLKGQSTDITAYSLVSGRAHFTVTALTAAPANDVTLTIS